MVVSFLGLKVKMFIYTEKRRHEWMRDNCFQCMDEAIFHVTLSFMLIILLPNNVVEYRLYSFGYLLTLFLEKYLLLWWNYVQ